MEDNVLLKKSSTLVEQILLMPVSNWF